MPQVWSMRRPALPAAQVSKKHATAFTGLAVTSHYNDLQLLGGICRRCDGANFAATCTSHRPLQAESNKEPPWRSSAS